MLILPEVRSRSLRIFFDIASIIMFVVEAALLVVNVFFWGGQHIQPGKPFPLLLQAFFYGLAPTFAAIIWIASRIQEKSKY
jgi:hypothetical protein